MEKQEKQMTVREVLGATIAILENVRVPIIRMEEMGTPIRQAISNLRVCIDAMDKAAEEAKDERKADPE